MEFEKPSGSPRLQVQHLGHYQEFGKQNLEHFHVLEESASSIDNSNGGMERWKPPDAGIVKLNVDVAFGNGKSTVAVVARNLKTWAKLTDHLNPSLAEASAIT